MHAQIQEAFRLIENGAKQEAADIFEQIKAEKTNDVELISERGRLALHLDENIFAANSFSAAADLRPENPFYLYLLATTHEKMGNSRLAAELSKKVVERDPNHYEPYVILGNSAMEDCNFVEAADYFEKAVQFKPVDPLPYHCLIRSLAALRKHDEALHYSQELLRLDSSSAINHLPIGRVMIGLGKSEEAIAHFETALDIDNTCGFAYQDLSCAKKFTPEDKPIMERAEQALQKKMSSHERSRIHFSLGKMYNDCKQWDKAFENYKQANVLDKPGVEPTWLPDRYKVEKKIFNKSIIQQTELFGSDSDVPVFIVGMPRTGTTLLEQIIASHPQGDGAGELSGIARTHTILCEGGSKADLEANLTKESLAKSANEYLKLLRATRESAVRVVDKQPNNYVYLGLMYKLFPNARFIHAVRNPLDTCLSCYFQAFTHLTETYDMEWLGRTYCLYREIMDHWKRVLPEGTILDVQYEHVVQDIEAQSRRIIDFCDLPWDAQCLEFYKTERAVITASVWQVRQPIYSSSRGRWVNYAQHLGVLANEIRDYLDDEDIAELEKHGVKINRKWGMGFLKRTKK